MHSNISYYLEEISKPIAVVVGLCYMLLALVLIPFPANYAVASLPLCVSYLLAHREDLRIARLGFCHDRVREISEEQMQRALDYLERERRKTKHL